MPLSQLEHEVLVREPGKRQYSNPVHVSVVAEERERWLLAALSEDVYLRDWKPDPGLVTPLASLAEWHLCNDFISEGLRLAAFAQGLYLEVWRRQIPTEMVVVSFKGTNFLSRRDWRSNLRWFLRHLPWFRDQYTLLCNEFGAEFADWAARTCGANTRLCATGHSLGGGLAQQFAYALPLIRTRDHGELRVSYVCAFDPSPVTGWSSVEKDTRSRNAKGLEIDRLFEHGEILAYLRLILSYALPPSAANPSIREIRVNFDRRPWAILNHMMDTLARGLARSLGKVGVRGDEVQQ